MAKTPQPKKPPEPAKGPTCGTCGQPKKDHTIEQLAECLAQQN